MKSIILKAFAISICILSTAITFSQNVTIDYQAWNPASPPCDIFVNATNVPATINGTSSTIEHQTLIGDAKYSTSDQSVQLDNNYISASNIRGTKYRIAYSFKVGYRYIITVTSAELNNTAGTSLGPYLRLDLTNAGGGGGTACVGPETINQNLSGNPAAVPYNSTSFQDVQFAFSTALSATFTTLEVSSIPATNGGSNSVRIRKITIAETPPAPPAASFSLSPTSVAITCGTSVTQTFTVTNDNNTPGVTSYLWNLGSTGSAWLYNGSPAPTTPFVAPSSITLTSLAVAPNFGDINVTPSLNGIAQPMLSAHTTFVAPNFGLVGGSSTICTGTSSPFYIMGTIPSNSSIFWGTTTSLPNYGATVVSVDNQYSSSTTLTKINSGVINLTVSVTDGCNQTYSRTRENIRVGGYANTDTLSGYTLAYPPCYTQGCTPSAVSNPINTQGPVGTKVYSGTSYANTENHLYLYNSELSGGTWSLVSGSPWYWSSTDGNNLTVYPGDSNPIQFRLTANNSCGSLYYDFTFYPYSGYRMVSNIGGYKIFPNPAHGNITVTVDEGKLRNHRILKSIMQDIMQVIILDKMGLVQYKQVNSKGIKQMNINVSNFKTGFYLIRIYNGKEWSVLPFSKQ